MTTVEIVQLVIITFLVPWLCWLTYAQIALGRENSALAATSVAKTGSPCALHDGVMTRIDDKLDKLTQTVAELTGYLRSAGHDGHDGATGERGPKGDSGDGR